MHELYSANIQRWFPWLFPSPQLRHFDKVFKIGCEEASLWKNYSNNFNVTLSNKSEGMINDARGNLRDKVNYQVINYEAVPLSSSSFDLVIVNIVLFYLVDLNNRLGEVKRI